MKLLSLHQISCPLHVVFIQKKLYCSTSVWSQKYLIIAAWFVVNLEHCFPSSIWCFFNWLVAMSDGHWITQTSNEHLTKPSSEIVIVFLWNDFSLFRAALLGWFAVGVSSQEVGHKWGGHKGGGHKRGSLTSIRGLCSINIMSKMKDNRYYIFYVAELICSIFTRWPWEQLNMRQRAAKVRNDGMD